MGYDRYNLVVVPVMCWGAVDSFQKIIAVTKEEDDWAGNARIEGDVTVSRVEQGGVGGEGRDRLSGSVGR